MAAPTTVATSLRSADYFPPILVQGWKYDQVVVQKESEAENILLYICRVISWFVCTIFSCSVQFKECPSRFRQVIHQVRETFTCVDAAQGTYQNGEKILDFLLAPIRVFGHRHSSAIQGTTLERNICVSFTSIRTIVNWGIELRDYDIQLGGQSIITGNHFPTTSSLPGSSNLRMPFAEDFSIQMYPGAKFVLSNDKLEVKGQTILICKLQLQAIFKWLNEGKEYIEKNIVDEADRNQLAFELFLRDYPYSLEGYWTVELIQDPSGKKCIITTPIGKIQSNQEQQLKFELTRPTRTTDLSTFVDVGAGRIGYALLPVSTKYSWNDRQSRSLAPSGAS